MVGPMIHLVMSQGGLITLPQPVRLLVAVGHFFGIGVIFSPI